MKKSKNTNRNSLMASGLSLVLCMAMLIGTTFAWFSDTVSNKGNKIQAGNLQIGFYTNALNGDNGDNLDENNWIDLEAQDDPIFVMGNDTSPAQPGDTLTRYIMIKNLGSIDLKYELDAVVDDQGLGDAITFDFELVKLNDADSVVKYPTVTGSALNGVIAKGVSTEKGEYVIYKAVIHFLQSAGNEYQGKGFKVDLNLSATQNKDGATIVRAGNFSDLQTALNGDATAPTIVLSRDMSVGTPTDTTSPITIENGKSISLDLNKQTISTPADGQKYYRPITVDSGTLNLSNGTIITNGAGTNSTNGTGSYGSIYATNGSKLSIDNMTLENSRPWGLNVKLGTGSEATLRNTKIKSSYGGGIEVAGGKADLYDCTVTQTGYFDWCSTAIAASTGGTLNVHGGSYTSENYCVYVFNSGANINIYDGQFKGSKAVLKVDKAGMNIYGGDFDGKIEVNDASSLKIMGGTFTNHGLSFDAFKKSVAEGYVATENNGAFSVTKA